MRGPFIVLHLVKCEAFVEGQERHITYYNAEPPIVNQIVSKTKGFVLILTCWANTMIKGIPLNSSI